MITNEIRLNRFEFDTLSNDHISIIGILQAACLKLDYSEEIESLAKNEFNNVVNTSQFHRHWTIKMILEESTFGKSHVFRLEVLNAKLHYANV